jgi:hypothetical protein
MMNPTVRNGANAIMEILEQTQINRNTMIAIIAEVLRRLSIEV